MKDLVNNKDTNESILNSLNAKLAARSTAEVLGAFMLFICGFFTVLSIQNGSLFLKELLVADAILALILFVAVLGKNKQ